MGIFSNRSDDKKKRITRERLKKAVRIFKFVRPYRWHFIGGLILLSLSSLLFMIFPGAAGEMANAASGKPKFDITVREYGIIFLVILIIQGIFSYLRTVLFAIVSEKGMAGVRQALYDRLITQSISFFEERRVGELTSRLTTDVEKLQSAFSITLAEFIRQIVILLSGLVILAWLTPELSLIMLLTFPVIVILALVFGRYIRKISRVRQDQLADANTIVEETFQSFQIVKAFANEWLESMRYRRSVDEIVSISLRYARIRGLFFVFIITILFGGIFFILWQGAMMVQADEMPVGDLFSFIIYTGILGAAIASLGNLYTQLAGAMGATQRVVDILETDGELEIEQTKEVRKKTIEGLIEYKNVSFSYPTRPHTDVLKNISFRVDPGQKIALVGPSGAGKSTIVQLLMRFYTVQRGEILVDGQPLESYDLHHFRENLGIVPQEVLLFGGTIRENILYGDPEADDEAVIEAARNANAWDFIDQFPDALDTIVGDRGIKLSGGQRQRIAIARAILKDPSILILDEATSSLDAESENVVQEALQNLMKGRTSIVIAHRLSTIRDVDCIFVIDDGSIVESGNHHELTQKEDGAYNALTRLQFEME